MTPEEILSFPARVLTQAQREHYFECGYVGVQKLVPRVPPRLLGPLIRLLGSKRFVEWSFDHYLRIAPPPPRERDFRPARVLHQT